MNHSSRSSLWQTVFRVLSGLIGLCFLLLGLGFMAFPDIFSVGFSVQSLTIQGLNAIRGDMGGLFLGLSFFCFLGAVTKHWTWLAVPLILLLLIVVGRLISLGLDGSFVSGTRAVILEGLLLILLWASTLGLALTSKPQKNGSKATEILNFTTLITVVVIAALLTTLLLFREKIGLGITPGIATKAMGTDVFSALTDGLHVALCGSGAPLPDPRRASACTAVIAGKRFYVVDTGPGSERKLELMRLNPGNVTAVLLTHFHSDHIGDLGELMLKRWSGGGRENPLVVFGPEGVEIVVQGFNNAYSLDNQYRILHHGPETVPPSGAGGVAKAFNFPRGQDEIIVINDFGLKVTAFLVDHSPVKPAVGYRFDYKGRSVVISGDTIPVPSLRKQAKGVDLLVQEALQPTMVGMLKEVAQKVGRTNTAKIMGDIPSYHTSPEDAARMAAEAGVRHLLLTHILPPLPVSDLKPAFLGKAKKIFQGPITVGEDGMLFSLPVGSNRMDWQMLL